MLKPDQTVANPQPCTYQAVIARLSRQALSTTTLANLYNRIVIDICHTLNAESCEVLEFLKEEKMLISRASSAGQSATPQPAGVSEWLNRPAGLALIAHQPIVIHHQAAGNGVVPFTWVGQHPGSSSISVAISGQQPYGTLSVYDTSTRNFTQADVYFLQAVAGVLATAIEKRRAESLPSPNEAEAARQTEALLAETNERQRLAKELHDNVAQSLGYLKMKVSMALMLLEQGQSEALPAQLADLKDVVSEAYTDVREEIFYLRSGASLDIKFLETLQDYIDKYRRYYNLDVTLLQEANATFFEFPGEVAVQLMRTIQEALINVRKHAHVTRATVRLQQVDNHIHISIEDQGQGFNPGQLTTGRSSSFGLEIMQERMEKIGGDLSIRSTPGQGTIISLNYPRP